MADYIVSKIPVYTDNSIRVKASTTTTGDITLYVSATGNDNNDGLTSGTALATIQAAVNKLPSIIQHAVVISIGAGTFEKFYLDGIKIMRKMGDPVPSLKIQGTMGQPTLSTGTATGTSTSGGTRTLTDTGQSWTVNELRGKFCKIDSDYRVIKSNTATELTLCGTRTGGYSAKAYEILEPKTIVTKVAVDSVNAVFIIRNISFGGTPNDSFGISYIKFDATYATLGAYAYPTLVYNSPAVFSVCQFTGGCVSEDFGMLSFQDCSSYGAYITDCYFANNDKGHGLAFYRVAILWQFDRCFVYNTKKSGILFHQGYGRLNFGEVHIDTTGAHGIDLQNGKWVDIDYAEISNCTGYGIIMDNARTPALIGRVYNNYARSHLNVLGTMEISNCAMGGIFGCSESKIDIDDCSGTGNTGWGITLERGSSLNLNGTTTITGSNGDLTINDSNTTLTWATHLANDYDLAVALDTRCTAQRMSGGGASAAITTWLSTQGIIIPPLIEIRNNTEPTLAIGEACIWLDQDAADATYLVYRNSQNAQLKVQLS